MDPLADTMSPRYLTLSAVFMTLLWTLSVGHCCLHFDCFPIWRTTLLLEDSVNLCISIKEFITPFFFIEGNPQSAIARMSSTMPNTQILIPLSPLYVYVNWSCGSIILLRVSILLVHFKLPHTDPCISTLVTLILVVILLLTLTAMFAFQFSR